MEQTAYEGLIVRQKLAQFGVGQHAAVDVNIEFLRPVIGRINSIPIAQILTDIICAVHAVRVPIRFVRGLWVLQVLRERQNLHQRAFTLLDFSLVLGLVGI